MEPKFLKKYCLALFLVLALIYAPVVNAGNVVKAVGNFFTPIVNAIANWVIGTSELFAGVFQCAGNLGTDCSILDQGVCRLGNLTESPGTVACPEGGILTIGPAISDVSACLVTVNLTFYDNVGPHSAGEQNSAVQIYRFTLPQTERYYPVGGLTDGQAQSAAVMNWLATLDNQVGNGLISPYEFKESSYFMLNAATATPLTEVPYGNFCDAGGVCKIRDQSLPKDVYIAYLARIKANYDFTIPNEGKVVYDVQATCPAGTIQTVSWDGKIYCQGASPVYYLSYNSGRIPVTQETFGKWYIADAKGNKIYSLSAAPPLWQQDDYRNYKFEFKESEKPHDFDVEYPIQAKCPEGSTTLISGNMMSCKSRDDYGRDQYGPPNFNINYNSGKILVTAEPLQRYPRITERFSFTDSKGVKVFSTSRADLNANLIVQASCPDGYNYDGRGNCYNYSKQPYEVKPVYYLNEPTFKVNDKKLNAPLLVSHDIIGTCPQGTQTTADGLCYGYNPSFWGLWGYSQPSPTHISYNGGKILFTYQAATNQYYIIDALGNKVLAQLKSGVQYPRSYKDYEFRLTAGTPDSQKFFANYPFYNSATEFSLSGYNGGKFFSGLFYNINTANNYGNINGLHFYLGDDKYHYPTPLPTELSIVVDKYGSAAPEIVVRREGKFLSAKSGEPVTDTYIGSPFSLISGNGILGPFKPLADVACAPLISAPTVINQTCNSVTLESKELRPLNVLRRVKGSTTGFALASQFDFSGGRTFTDTNLQSHTNYEYTLALPTADLGAAVSAEQIAEAYTFCRPKCSFLTTAKDVAELGETSLDWKCEADTVPISCQVQSDDLKVGTLSSLSSQGSVSISPSQDSRYLLTCTNVDGSVTAQPLRINVFQPGIKEVKP